MPEDHPLADMTDEELLEETERIIGRPIERMSLERIKACLGDPDYIWEI